MYKILYFLLLIVIPIIVMFIKGYFIYAGIWGGIGLLIVIIEKTKLGKKIEEILF